MGLTAKQETRMKKMPIFESQVRKSKDGKFLIHRTIITHIRPIGYYQAVLANEEPIQVDELDIKQGSELVV